VAELLASGHADAAEEQIEELSLDDRLPPELLARLRRETAARQSPGERAEAVNTPSDYLALPHARVLHGFRRLNAATDPIPRYPRGMPLPPIPGMGNDTDFLLDASTGRAMSAAAGSRRVHAIISNATVAEAQRLVDRLAAQMASRPLGATIFLPTASGEIRPSPHVTVEIIPRMLLEPSAVAHLAALAQRGDDNLLFLEGGVELDDSFIARALFLAETTDNLLQVLRVATQRDALRTCFSPSAAEDLRKDPRPYERINGFNFVVPARLLRRVGHLESRFETSGYAARELGYRAHLLGGYFRALPVPALPGSRDDAPSSADSALFDSLCPRPGVPREGGSFERPRVSVYIPAHNAERFVVQAVRSALDQDVRDLEVCVFEDGSSDATLDELHRNFVDDPRVVVESGRNGGIGYASNRAVRSTRAPYIAQLDADDVLKPGAIRRLMEYLDRHADVACCYGSCERIDDDGVVIGPEYSWPVFSREKMMLNSIVHHPRMFRRSAWERTAGFREDIQNAVDYDMFLKLSEVGRVHHIGETIYQRRWHGRNTSLVNVHAQTRNTWRVQEAALKRLDLAHDWQVSVPKPSEPRTITYARRANRRCVVFWPDYSRSNPYQKLLYRKVRTTHDVVAGTIESALSILGEFEFRSMVTFHLHWLNFIFAHVKTAEEAESAARDFVQKLKDFKALGGRIVWTVHNAVSHDSEYEETELRLSEQVAEIADVLHFHSQSSVDEVAASFPFRREKAVVSRHGSFVGVYPDFVDRDGARRALDISADADVLLSLGQIRGYKGLDRLLEAFRDLSRTRPNAILLIAGEDKAGLLPGLLEGLSPEDRARVRVAARRIDDFEMQVFFRAADLAVLPYRRILTSGSLLLAMSFGMPAVIPDVGMCREVLGARETGFLYPADGGAQGLLRAMEECLSLKDRGELSRIGQNARARAESLRWPNFARVFETWRV
jgi:glycosyltransferase involved in cell wall biosynthesis